ncbi:MAG: B12-binding domain-containing radical SAM protein [Deltaproteobacteria bacterium]|nr:B12-binding domain-containing radical SAM protein [Deltaproteobacteria bacterium]
MRVCLIGADFEENLALGILASVAVEAGHEPWVLPFNAPEDAPKLVERVLSQAPDVVGLSVQFQHRADEFFTVARALRAGGYRGHITVGGHFPTLAFAETLERDNQVDSVVLHDGEQTFAELLGALDRGTALHEVAGLALLSQDGKAFRTVGRSLIADLDGVPHMLRYRPHTRHLGVPFIPIMAGRGCWGRCTFCSIQSMYRDGRAYGGGELLRTRSPEDVAAEMALLWHRAGRTGIFCFHDDNFLMPRPADSLARVQAIRSALDDYGVGHLAIMGKCRPETVTPELAHALAELGVIRLYVGIENSTVAGAKHLGRSVQQRAVRTALAACREAGIFACYNMLIFEPDATIEDIRGNIRFMRQHAHHPVNFCRAEPYYGTLLQADVAKRQALKGSYLGWTYRLENDRAELLYRICAAAFAERNFDADGVANRYMSLGYTARVLEHFHGDKGDLRPLLRRVEQLTRGITLDTTDLLDQAIELAETASLDDWDECERRAGLLGLEVAAKDQHWHRELDDLLADIDDFVAVAPLARPEPPPARKPLPHKCTMAVGLSLAVAWSACGDDVEVGGTGGSGGTSTSSGTGGTGGTGAIYDPAPGGMGGVYDMAPGGMGGTGGVGGAGGAGGAGGGDGGSGVGGIADPPPGPMGMGPAYAQDQDSLAALGASSSEGRGPVVDRWRDTSAMRVRRTRDLPLYEPPNLSLEATRRGDEIVVCLRGEVGPYTTRWEAEGSTVAAGRRCVWYPRSPDERLRVGIRSFGGIAVLSLRADEVEA